MKKYLVFTCSLLFLALLNQAAAQNILTLDEAIRITLENNYNIKLIANNLEISRNNVNPGVAGALPYVGGTLTNTNSVLDSRQVQANGTVTERAGARNTGLNYGIGLNWTIFDGFGMFARYDQLKELERLGEENLQVAVMENVAEVTKTYYYLVQQQQQLNAYDTAVFISQQRVQFAQNRYQVGKASKLEVLNAEVDMNTDTTNLVRQNELYNNTQTSLNQLMARDPGIRFTVVNEIPVDKSLLIGTLTEQASKHNPALQAAIINKRVAQLDLRIIKSYRYPILNVNTGYNFTNSTSALGFATQTSGKGLTYGLTATVPIFNGFTQNIAEHNYKILINSADLRYEQLNQTIISNLTSAYQTYKTSLVLVTLEERNQRIAKENLDITIEKFRLGSITTVEFRAAQLNYINATVRYSTAQYNAKVAEVSLNQISGTMEY
ncbi:TolC family protein [Cytophaga hutchinsonii]|jgi:outer membrane protein|uniref:Outer membrane efflux protein n=1 Tax=Cytophaga hutchinsonii (strain ATCC 33406 / DSM 1761 / CIP 103989 / NBRC 15051 / NCIMB 9469 / D465) TaxID=269798 RepID=A0A6N4STZ9_CYTH3|nr:TolC family protein [Cytophaga hutchinsonii]ABG59911.1 outer membrane efflux protein [Cytophaga hutchinsonii ATCC 33406]SFX27545.1 Outer membrane protein TolC [Cytophaga hutchinsonii ATCC 33406]